MSNQQQKISLKMFINIQLAAEAVSKLIQLGIEPTGTIEVVGIAPVIWVHPSAECKKLIVRSLVFNATEETHTALLDESVIKWTCNRLHEG